MNVVELIGIAAGSLTTVSFAPQAIKILSTRRVDDISMAMYVSFVSGVALWIVYGIAIRSMPLVLANLITLMLAGSVLIMKIRFGRLK